jgi:hypothetical protein
MYLAFVAVKAIVSNVSAAVNLLHVLSDFGIAMLTGKLTTKGIRVQHVGQELFTANVAGDRLNRLELHGYILAECALAVKLFKAKFDKGHGPPLLPHPEDIALPVH